MLHALRLRKIITIKGAASPPLAANTLATAMRRLVLEKNTAILEPSS